MAEGQHLYGQSGADRAVGRTGPAARMTEERTASRSRPSVLIPPVASPLAPTPPPAPDPVGHGQPAPAAATEGAVLAGGTSWDATRNAAPPVDAPDSPPAPTAAAKVARSAVGQSAGPRSARLFLTHIDPWSVMKQAFLLSLALAVVVLAASAALWFALESAGVLDAITRTATEVGGESGSSVGGFLQLGRVMGVALVLAGIETVLITALSTLFAFMYNLSVGVGGGLEVTLSED